MNISDFSFFNPVKVYFGVKSYNDILKKVIGTKESKFALFYGKSAMKKIGVIDAIKDTFSNFEIKEFGNINSNPNVEDIEAEPRGFMQITPPSSKQQKETSQELSVCKQCGATLSADYAYCNKCGSKL